MDNEKEKNVEIVETEEGKIDEMGGFNIESHIKIFDPSTGDIILDRRD